jgi:hypothetical protein
VIITSAAPASRAKPAHHVAGPLSLPVGGSTNEGGTGGQDVVGRGVWPSSSVVVTPGSVGTTSVVAVGLVEPGVVGFVDPGGFVGSVGPGGFVGSVPLVTCQVTSLSSEVDASFSTSGDKDRLPHRPAR